MNLLQCWLMRSRAAGTRVVLGVTLLSTFGVGCDESTPSNISPNPERPDPVALPELPESVERAPVIAPSGPEIPASTSVPAAPSGRPGLPSGARDILPAAILDEDYAGSDSVVARRLVYRVSPRVPGVLGVAPSTMPVPAAELYIDVSDDRLRARFAGPGWPVEAGSEVRVRRGFPGVYVFDSRGGRPLAPGQLASWFQGGEVRRNQFPGVGVRPPSGRERSGPGPLLCALLAEWTGQEREGLARRCGDGGPPLMFRVGPWRGERTADVPVELPRSALRADHESPPRPIGTTTSRAFMDPSALARLEPRRSSRRASREEPAADQPGEGIRVRNEGPTHILFLVHGVPIGRVDVGAEGYFVGLRPGVHQVGAMTPLGQLAWRVRDVTVPTSITIR